MQVGSDGQLILDCGDLEGGDLGEPPGVVPVRLLRPAARVAAGYASYAGFRVVLHWRDGGLVVPVADASAWLISVVLGERRAGREEPPPTRREGWCAPRLAPLRVVDNRSERWRAAEARIAADLRRGLPAAAEDLLVCAQEQAAWDASHPELAGGGGGV